MLCSLMAPLCSAGCRLKLSGGMTPSSGTMSTHAGSAGPENRQKLVATRRAGRAVQRVLEEPEDDPEHCVADRRLAEDPAVGDELRQLPPGRGGEVDQRGHR